MKLPISLIMVGYNEADLLQRSLPTLQFCDELLYFDLGSQDNSIEIAKKLGAKVILHEKVDGCEWIHSEYAGSTKHKWLMITDPDEVLDEQTTKNIFNLFNNNLLSDKTGCVSVPIFYYFNNKRLKGTTWGGEKRRILLAHNERFKFLPIVHAGRDIIEGFIPYNIPSDGKSGIKHYWMISYPKLFEKHIRYLKNEAQSRYKTGQRVTIKQLLLTPLKAFKYSYYQKKGYKDAFIGLFLSLFWAWYETVANYKLFVYQHRSR